MAETNIHRLGVFETLEGDFQVFPRRAKENSASECLSARPGVSNWHVDVVTHTGPSMQFESSDKQKRHQQKETK